MADVSVVVVSYRSGETLDQCLKSLVDCPTRRLLEIVVVDNDPEGGSTKVAGAFDQVRLIRAERNLGYAAGVNRGVAATSGHYLMVLNPDVEMRPRALEGLADFLDAHPTSGIAAPKLLNPDGSLQPSCRREYTPAVLLLRRTVLGRLFPNASALRRHLMFDYDHQTPRSVPWVTGAAMMVRRQALEDVGGMDERYFLYFEDVEWCTRMRAGGWSVDYVPHCSAIHDWQRASQGWTPMAGRHLLSGLRFWLNHGMGRASSKLKQRHAGKFVLQTDGLAKKK